MSNQSEQSSSRRRKGRGARPRSRESEQQDNARRPLTRRPPVAPARNSLADALLVCHRCSFFFGGYRALFGADKPLDLIDLNGWLNLGWRAEMRELLERSYGIELHSDTLHYEGRCAACARIFVYAGLPIEADAGDLPPVAEPPALLIQSIPYTR